MSDLAFNNYCITCDKLCSQNSIYCSEECKLVDEYQSSNIIDQTTHHQHDQKFSNEEFVSPLLTPSLYQHYNNYTISNQQLNNSPLILSSTINNNNHDNDLDYHHFDLNYSVSTSNISSTQSNNLTDHLPSTSHNYRKWLTACL